MSRPARFALRFLIVVAVVSLVPTLVTSPGQAGHSPYVSSLSDLVVPQMFAASSCNFKACAGGSRHNIVCAKVTTAFECFTYQGFCINQNCT